MNDRLDALLGEMRHLEKELNYGIPKVHRGEYLAFDRHRLSDLKLA